MKYELKAENPIGVIDSGVGGISVLRELVKVLPCENFIFLETLSMLPMEPKPWRK